RGQVARTLCVHLVRERRFCLGSIDRVVRGTVEDNLRSCVRDRGVDALAIRDRNGFASDARLLPEQTHQLGPQLSARAEDERFQSEAWSACRAVPDCCPSRAVISLASTGRPTRNPCAASHPASMRIVSATRSCRPSATTRSPRLWPRPTADRTIAAESVSDASAETNERSI